MFKLGDKFRRKDLHLKYGGQQQSGISTPKNFSGIFLFTSPSGKQHGYQDGYQENGLYWYTGQGQGGDMKMTGGNKAIRDHQELRKVLHVFESTEKAYVRYIGRAECLDYHESLRHDRHGQLRKVFIFHLSIDSSLSDETVDEFILPPQPSKLQKLRDVALNKSDTNLSQYEKIQIVRLRSKAIKDYILERAKGHCEGCKLPAPFKTKSGPFLECHHLYRLADGGPDSPSNVIALCPNCHRKAHLSQNAETYNADLQNIARQAEQQVLLSM